MDLEAALAELRARNTVVPRPARLPTAAEVEAAEASIARPFPSDYRRFLLEASDVVVGYLEPCVVVPDGGYRDLIATCAEAWADGVPSARLSICQDNGDYFCLDGERVRYWSHNGLTDEHWPDLATWIDEVWIGEAG